MAEIPMAAMSSSSAAVAAGSTQNKISCNSEHNEVTKIASFNDSRQQQQSPLTNTTKNSEIHNSNKCNIGAAKTIHKNLACSSESDNLADLVAATSVSSCNLSRTDDGIGARELRSTLSSNIDDDSDGREKTDATPENIKKIDEIIAASRSQSSALENDLKIVEGDESPSKHPLAFTIDFKDSEASSNAAAKYKNMLERFQNRHKRGVSLSKLELSQQQSPASSASSAERPSRINSAPLCGRQTQAERSPNYSMADSHPQSEASKVKLRIRDRSTSGIRDANKRHSWSPKSSATEQTMEAKNKPLEKQQYVKITQPSTPLAAKKIHLIHETSSSNRIEKPTNNVQKENRKQPVQSSASHSFTPRSTAMQLALNKVDFSCPEPLLDDLTIKQFGDDESVSEAGTYTVDGDNYTEEQKELMNIDKSRAAAQLELEYSLQCLTDSNLRRPQDLPLKMSADDGLQERKLQNVLEVSYCHESGNAKPKTSYLEKIKSRVKSITKSPDKLKPPSLERRGASLSPGDLGTFTSVTTSGVLSKKPTLDTHPKLNRKHSLTKSIIDSSEYISAGDSKFKMKTDLSIYPNTFTDHEKAEYKLSVFTSHTDSRIPDASIDYSPNTPQTPDSPTTDSSKLMSEATGLKTAQTKSDWIQEWARNARRSTTSGSLMTRSYDFGSTQQNMSTSVGGVGVDSKNFSSYNNKTLERLRVSRGLGDYEYSSETDVTNGRRSHVHKDELRQHSSAITSSSPSRPPLSPSKIPSPMHTVGRARSISRTRGSLQDLSPLMNPPDTEIYLQKTAAVISNLSQSLSRKNSLQSPTTSSSNSPRRLRHNQQYFSADENSPTHSGPSFHKRNLSYDYRNNLMTHSLNSDPQNNQKFIEYGYKPRQNSFDADLGSPTRRYYQKYTMDSRNIDQTKEIAGATKKSENMVSPIRRSSSFSVKPYTTVSAAYGRSIQKTVNFPNHPNAIEKKNPIQKSASSTSFKKMFTDYDSNAEYYINDEDDLNNDYYSSDEIDDPADSSYRHEPERVAEPLTNTRYNKALLMRIERSKQKVTGQNSNQTPQSTKNGAGGVIACPNTPELPRRANQSVARTSMRQSVPRDSSLNRLRGEIPSSLASAKKQLLQTATTTAPAGKKVQPKYLDISKYKPVQGANFLRKNDAKSTLASKPEIRRSPSSASVQLSRADPNRVSNRSVKSAGARSIPSVGGGGSKWDTQVPKPKEAELLMWKRRATYDPMKAAAEGKRRQEEAKKLSTQMQSKSGDRNSSQVLRSQSFHSGVGTFPTRGLRLYDQPEEEDRNYRWTLTSTESSDEDDGEFVN